MTEKASPGGGSSTANSKPTGNSARITAGADAIEGRPSGQRNAAWHSGPAQWASGDAIIAAAGAARQATASMTMLIIVPHPIWTVRLEFSVTPPSYAASRAIARHHAFRSSRQDGRVPRLPPLTN